MDDLISRQAAIDELERGAWGKEWDKTLARAMIESVPSAHPLDPCETCLHKGKGWDEEPCDGCTGTESKYKPIVSPDGTLIVNVPKGTKVKRVIVLPYADGE